MIRRHGWTHYVSTGAQALVAIAALAFAIHALRKQWSGSSVDLGHIQPNWLWVAISGALFLITYAVLIETWREVLRAWRMRLSFMNAARIWSVSNLYRYVPGKLWQIGAMGVMAQRARINPIPATGSAILNVAVNLIAGFLVGATFGWPLLNLSGHRTLTFLFVAACAVAVGALPFALPPMIRLVSRLTGRDLGVEALPPSAIVVSLVGNVVSWLIYGLAFAVFARGIIGGAQGSLTGYIAVYAISYLVGYLVLFAPAGVGFREASMIALLPAARLADPTQAAILAVTSRLWLTALEIAPGALFLGFDGLRSRPREG